MRQKDQLLDADQAALMLDISRSTLWRREYDKEIIPIYVGKKKLFSLKQLNVYLNNKNKKPKTSGTKNK